jgi:hypothetical protein
MAVFACIVVFVGCPKRIGPERSEKWCVFAAYSPDTPTHAIVSYPVPFERNFRWVRKRSKSNSRRLKRVAEPIVDEDSNFATLRGEDDGKGRKIERRLAGDGHVVNINPYISGMIAASLGLKWADAIRRVCMYTKARDEHKGLYALLRGLFPVQELCACMTAILLARRDVLGQQMPLWRLLLPAVVLHGMANFRGMKVRSPVEGRVSF